jgi:hypothetical protein
MNTPSQFHFPLNRRRVIRSLVLTARGELRDKRCCDSAAHRKGNREGDGRQFSRVPYNNRHAMADV